MSAVNKAKPSAFSRNLKDAARVRVAPVDLSKLPVFSQLQTAVAFLTLGTVLSLGPETWGDDKKRVRTLGWMAAAHFVAIMFNYTTLRIPRMRVNRLLVVALPVSFMALFLLGAPVFSSFTESFGLAALVALQLALPALMTARAPGPGMPADSWSRLKTPAIASLALAPLASIAYALDWKAWWQVYPVPSIVGVQAAILIGSVVATVV